MEQQHRCDGCETPITPLQTSYYCGLSHHSHCLLCQTCNAEVERYIAENGNVPAPGTFDHSFGHPPDLRRA